MVLSITPDIPENSDEVFMDIADEIASYFSEYQSVYSVHKDTRHRHIHMVLNSVSYETGKKFSQSKQELNQLKGYFNHVLSDYELDIIKTKTDDILDENPYNFDDGFDFLEIDYDEEENEITIYDDNDYDAPYISEESCSHIEKTRKTEENALVITGVNNESEDIFMKNNKFFEHANTNCNYENEVPFDVQSDPIYNQQIPTQIPQPYMSPVPSAPQFYPEPVPQNMYPTNPPVSPQQYPVPDAYHPYAGPTQQNIYPTNPSVNPQQYPVPDAYQPYAGPTPQNMYPTNPPVSPQQYPVPDAYHPYAGPTQQNIYPTNPSVNLHQNSTLFINYNQNLNIRVSETADPEITNRYITHFANIPNDSIDKVKLGMAVMHKFNQQNTLRKLKFLFRQMYSYAMRLDICGKNYSEFVDIARYKDKNPNARARDRISEEDIKKLWTASENEEAQIVLMLIYTGVRVSELLDLKKSNINLDEQWFDVVKSKTENGIRKVPIADKLMPFFKSWYKRDCEYLICTHDNEHFTYRNYYDSYWKPVIAQLGIDSKTTPHFTRHTCVSMLADAGITPTIIKKIVGHSGAMSVTESVYTHLDIKVLVDAVNKITP